MPQPAHRIAGMRARLRLWVSVASSPLTAGKRGQINPDAEDALPRRDHISRGKPGAFDPDIVDKCPVGAPQVAQLAEGRIDLDHEVVAGKRHVLRHRAMDEARPTHNERIVAVEHERTTLTGTLQDFQYHSHRFVPGLPIEPRCRLVPHGFNPRRQGLDCHGVCLGPSFRTTGVILYPATRESWWPCCRFARRAISGAIKPPLMLIAIRPSTPSCPTFLEVNSGTNPPEASFPTLRTRSQASNRTSERRFFQISHSFIASSSGKHGNTKSFNTYD